MHTTISLDANDLKEAVADLLTKRLGDTYEWEVDVSAEMECVGRGEGEHDEPVVRVRARSR